MVKKYFIIVLLLCILGSSSLWANHIYGYTFGIPIALIGSGLLITNYVISEPNSAIFVTGALLVAGGLSWTLYDIFTHPKPDGDNVVDYS
jgi:hypothetical protein